jgi:CSLREA domain-containing protein
MRIHALLAPALVIAPMANAATFVVDTTSDAALGACGVAIAGDCSLRGAIMSANAAAGADSIAFDVPTTDPGFQPSTSHWRFLPATEFPLVSDALVIDGFSQTGATPSNHLPLSPIGHVLKIELRGPNVNSVNGILATGALTVRGLVFNNWSQAIYLFDGATHVIEGSYFGTDITGDVSMPNRYAIVLGGNVRIGGPTPAQSNLISGNRFAGLTQQRPITSLRVQGNNFGANRTLTAALAPQDHAIQLQGPFADAVVGGTTPEEANTLAGSNFNALYIAGQPQPTAGPPLLRVIGNVIGAGIGGVAIGNGLNPGSPSQAMPQIQIGMLGDCRVAIGGDAAGEGNLIAYGGQAGVAVNSCWGAPILGNSFLANRGQPIDLATTNNFDGPTPNDAGDVDGTGTNPFAVAAGNRLQNTVQIDTIVEDAANDELRVTLRVDSTPASASYPLRLDVYALDQFGILSPGLRLEYALADAQAPREFVLPRSTFARTFGITVTDAEGNTSEMILAGPIFADGFEEDDGNRH